MKATTLGLAALAAVALGASPALAMKHHVACASINSALASGKTAEQAAKSLHTTQDRVRSCSAAQSSAKGSGAQSAKGSMGDAK